MTIFPPPYVARPAAFCAVVGCKEPRFWYNGPTGREQVRRWCEMHATDYDLEVALLGQKEQKEPNAHR